MTAQVNFIALLLEHIKAITINFKEQNRRTGFTYNIFKIAGIGEREVIICRVLADLLDPIGLHAQGNLFLKLFIDLVIKPSDKNVENFNLSRAKVSTEYLINENRRIDILIQDNAMVIPIEVKIFAGEQDRQISDYAAFSRSVNTIYGFIPVIFLTPNGFASSEASVNDYIPISFEMHIIPWLIKCLNLDEIEKVPSIREILKQFIRAIRSFCGHEEDEDMENAIGSLIAESRENYEAALHICEVLKSDALNFSKKAYEIFRNVVFGLVQVKISNAKYLEHNNEDWYFIQIPIGGDYIFYANYDLDLTIESSSEKELTDSEMINKIKRKMFDLTGFHDEDWGGNCIWASSSAKYPGLENIDNDNIFKYELFKVYSKDAMSVANRIVSIAQELRKTYEKG